MLVTLLAFRLTLHEISSSMKKLLLATALLLCASLAQADLYQTQLADGTVSFSDKSTTNSQHHDTQITNPLEADELPGTWEATSANGNKSELTLRSNGSFVFEQENDVSLHHVYMCGTWESGAEALGLMVKALKRQLESGDIEQTDGAHQQRAPILSAQRDRMILVIQGEKLIFNRAG